MAGQNPASKIEDRLRENELLNKQGEIQENLLKIMERQAKLLDIQQKRLNQINLAKEIREKVEKDLLQSTKHLDILENNILKRNQRLLDNRRQLSILEEKRTKISATSASLVKDRKSEEAMIALSQIWDRVRKAQIHSRQISAEELKILENAARVQKLTLNDMLTSNKSVRDVTIEMMRQAKIQKLERDILSEKRDIAKELKAYRKEERENALLSIEDWINQRQSAQKWNKILQASSTVFTSLGIQTKTLAQLMHGPLFQAGSVFYFLFLNVLDLFKELDKAAFEARKQMGMMRDVHQPLRQQAEDLYKQYANLGVTVEHVYRTQKAIASELGSTHSATKDIVEQSSLMASQFGISEDTTVRMLKTLGQMNQTTAASQTQMIGFASAMANADGVPLPQVMDDVARASITTRTMFAKTPLDMIKAAVEARRMGTTLNQMSESSRKILNFTESMEAEMEASVLLGRPINLQLARQLAYSGKIAESNKEILRIAKMTDFEHMDPFQAEAFARATEKTGDELRSMIQSNRELDKIRSESNKRGNESLKKQLQDYENLQKMDEASAKARGDDVNLMIKQRVNQQRLVAISNNWKKIIMELGQAFLPIIDSVLEITANMMPLIGFGLKLAGPFYLIFSIVKKTLDVLAKISGFKFPKSLVDLGKAIRGIIPKKSSDTIKFIANVSKSLQGIYKGASNGFKLLNAIGKSIKPILSFFGLVLKLGMPFAKWIPYVGQLITLVQFLYVFGKKMIKIFNDPDMNFGQKIWAGLVAVKDSLYEVLIQPFVDVWNWLKKTFFGNSPSQLGTLIVKGITSVGSLIFNSLAFPFTTSFELIKSVLLDIGPVLLNSINSISGEIFNNITSPFKKAWDWIGNLFKDTKTIQPSVSTSAVLAKSATMTVPVDRPLTDTEIRSYKELDREPLTQNSSKRSIETVVNANDVSAMQSAILAELKLIRQDLLDGKIAVNLDGQLVSTTMNRNNSFRGTYGATQR